MLIFYACVYILVPGQGPPPSSTLQIHNLFTRCFSMQGRCHIWTLLIEFSSVALSWFTLSGLTGFTDVLFLMSESSCNPFLKAAFYSVSWVGEIVNALLNVSHAVPNFFFITVLRVTCCFFPMFYHCPMCHMLFLPNFFITVLCVTCCFFPFFLSLSYVSHAVFPMF